MFVFVSMFLAVPSKGWLVGIRPKSQSFLIHSYVLKVPLGPRGTWHAQWKFEVGMRRGSEE